MSHIEGLLDALTWGELDGRQRLVLLELLAQGWTAADTNVWGALERRGLVEVLRGSRVLTTRGRELAGWALAHEREVRRG